MKVHGMSGRSPPHYDSDGEESNTSSTGSISVAVSPHMQNTTSGLQAVPGTTSISDWYTGCQPAGPNSHTDPLGGLGGPFGGLHHGTTAAY